MHMFLYLYLAPRTCQVLKTPKSDQGNGMTRDAWKADSETRWQPEEYNSWKLVSLRNYNDVTMLNDFVCLFLNTKATPRDGLWLAVGWTTLW